MKKLLGRLATETFILDVDMSDLIPISENFKVSKIDENTLEIDIDKNHSLNMIFAELTAQGINVKSLRNKSNRLEELFIELVEKGNLDD